MKNQVKITATNGQISNTGLTGKDGIRSAIPSYKSAIIPNTSFDEVKAEDLTFKGQMPTSVLNEEPTKEATNSGIEPSSNEPSKSEIKEELKINKPALSLEQTLLLIKELADKTAHRDTYTGYINNLNNFVVSQNDDDMGKNDVPSFKGCELRIKDGDGNVFVTNSASVIFGTVEFMKGRFNERLAEVEAEIVIPV